ncbi:hypothetical protein [Synechococcus sp. FACHB-909]|nr:hypothetical protein [Synechococcus sp. FACHB-909]MBD2719472.1 hypothetical protein [Synechococcus sp. FACHB-909]
MGQEIAGASPPPVPPPSQHSEDAPAPSATYERLRQFIAERMCMSPIY